MSRRRPRHGIYGEVPTRGENLRALLWALAAGAALVALAGLASGAPPQR